ncbi:Sec61beta family-domain-containing protein [Thamnocephalis sphaerospora]|uniref:Protein transport protein Sec61 subunit beta n=1 Tax=Thamnocephalis sphaerospora TaxID=78915 RepID=A0A4P9XIU5_9FUNG|nr:Sec61beta family-domain-containing protein [Thamnocephalis sphaerospora]|eukprot:RKP05120.1 Sec61beta family-domain-containing protein [Thamnocephalis sphaerospora]
MVCADSTSTTPKGTIRRRNPNAGAASRQSGRGGSSSSGMMRMYTDDAPGLRVDPVVVLVLSLVFIGSVFVLHIYGKLTRG